MDDIGIIKLNYIIGNNLKNSLVTTENFLR